MSIEKLVKFALPVAAALLFAYAASSTLEEDAARLDPLLPSVSSPYEGQVSGIGVVEPASEIVSIATEVPGVVREVFVAPGADVEQGSPLFRLDDRSLRAALGEAEAGVEVARAAAASAEVAVADERQRLALYEAVPDARAVSRDEIARRRFAVQRAEAARDQAGAALAAAEARAAAVRVELDRLVVRAPLTGRVYSVDVRTGEFAAAGPLPTPLMTMGSAGRLHVRVEIDETDIARVRAPDRAVATVRGRAQERIDLVFVRFEPRAVEKRVMAGGAERVDTRVIEAIYSFDPAATSAFVGQRMDVYIEAEPLLVPQLATP